MEAKLSTEKVSNLLQQYPEYNEMLTQLFAQTEIITKEEVENGIKGQLQLWAERERKSTRTYLLIETHKIGSMAWLYSVFKPFLDKNGVVLYTENTKIIPGSELLLIDDFSLSGCHIAGTFENWMYKNPEVKNVSSVSIICCAVTNDAIRTFWSLGSQYECFKDVTGYYSQLVGMFSPRGISMDQLNDFHKMWNPERVGGSPACSFLTSYKIPNNFGSYPKVYEHVFNIDRTFMNDVKDPFA